LNRYSNYCSLNVLGTLDMAREGITLLLCFYCVVL